MGLPAQTINKGYPQCVRIFGTSPSQTMAEVTTDGNGNLNVTPVSSAGSPVIVELTDGVNTPLGTASFPVRIDPTGTTVQPVSATTNLPTFAATTLTNGTTSSSGWTVMVANGGANNLDLWRLVISVSAATNIGIGDGSTIFLGPYYLTANGAIVLDISSEPWLFLTTNLEVNNSNAVAITYTTYTTQR